MTNLSEYISGLPTGTFAGFVALFIAIVVTPLGFLLKKVFFKDKAKGSGGISQIQKGGAFSKNTQIGNLNINNKDKEDGQ